jgi:hypothetical protein
VGNIPISVWFIRRIAGEDNASAKYVWFWYFLVIARVVGCHAANPFIYGILDKKLLTFWKFCRQRKNS